MIYFKKLSKTTSQDHVLTGSCTKFAIVLAIVLGVASLASASCDTRPTLRKNSGIPNLGSEYLRDSVKVCQRLLNKKDDSGLSVDGEFGGRTKDAVFAWQEKQKIGVDGIVGPQTWESLCGSSTPRNSLVHLRAQVRVVAKTSE